MERHLRRLNPGLAALYRDRIGGYERVVAEIGGARPRRATSRRTCSACGRRRERRGRAAGAPAPVLARAAAEAERLVEAVLGARAVPRTVTGAAPTSGRSATSACSRPSWSPSWRRPAWSACWTSATGRSRAGPGMSKTRLGEALGSRGIAYEHRRGLGTPPDIRWLFKAGRLAEAPSPTAPRRAGRRRRARRARRRARPRAADRTALPRGRPGRLPPADRRRGPHPATARPRSRRPLTLARGTRPIAPL